MSQTAIPTVPPNLKVANPGPLGLFGFGLTTVLLSSINAGLIPPASIAAVVPLAFAYGGLAQFVAGIMEFRLGNTFGGVAFTSYSMFWWWFSLLLWTLGAGWLKAPAPQGMATALLLWGVFTFLLWIVTFRLNKLLCAAKDYGFGDVYGKVGGYFGLATGIDAILLAFFELLNAVAGYTVIPLGEPIVLNLVLAGRIGVAVV
jgi:succinate-acetate transporter protein